MEDTHRHLAAVVGAGPAGLYAAKELAAHGVQVALINRDIKPGGLAEYGIYFDKYKMKNGLRAQFRQILNLPGVHYFGNVSVGDKRDLTLEDLRDAGFEAILVTAGAQGTKWLGLPGEELTGVYHAKDLVYHYNRLPGYSQREFQIGKRVALVGMGNVMMDIAHYLISEKQVDEVMALARRGPAEAKFDRKELETVEANLDLAAYDAEVDRVSDLMRSLGEDPEQVKEFIHSTMEKALPTHSNTHFTMHFLVSPVRILGDGAGRVCGVEVEDNTLVMDASGEIKARSLGTRRILDVDTVVFAIGDRVDDALGLPVDGSVFAVCREPRYPQEGASFEVNDPASKCLVKDIFVAGWSRKASTGLVGVARKDGMLGAAAVMLYLAELPGVTESNVQSALQRLAGCGHPTVTSGMLEMLEQTEQERARALGLEEYKFDSNQEMIAAIKTLA